MDYMPAEMRGLLMQSALVEEKKFSLSLSLGKNFSDIKSLPGTFQTQRGRR